MKLIRFINQEFPKPTYGCVINDQVRLLNGDPFNNYTIEKTIGDLDQVKLLAPCSPSKVIGLAANYAGATGVTENMKEPLIFMKPTSSICGPFDEIICPFENIKAWGEAELGIVIGKKTKFASIEEGEKSIFGYLCANDVTADNIENRDHHLARSKGADTFCPIGPWIDTNFEPREAMISCRQNGRLIRQSTLDKGIWRDGEIINFLSQWMTLEVGDIIITGTPPRVVEKTYLNHGDVFEVEIAGLGRLKNKFLYKPENEIKSF
ncbi:MAG: fumarylacetoacetate hydrolase family protein [Parcubacteria group bacterium]